MQKISPKRRGRPELGPAALKVAAQSRLEDGGRLNKALLAGRISQNKAAKNADIPQGSLNGIVNGNRAINREDLRRLGRLGISADYLLGFDAPMFRGETLAAGTLETEIRTRVAREIATQAIGEPYLRENILQMIPAGNLLIDLLVGLMIEDCRAIAGWLERKRLIGKAISSLDAGAAADARTVLHDIFGAPPPEELRVLKFERVTFKGAGHAPYHGYAIELRRKS